MAAGSPFAKAFAPFSPTIFVATAHELTSAADHYILLSARALLVRLSQHFIGARPDTASHASRQCRSRPSTRSWAQIPIRHSLVDNLQYFYCFSSVLLAVWMGGWAPSSSLPVQLRLRRFVSSFSALVHHPTSPHQQTVSIIVSPVMLSPGMLLCGVLHAPALPHRRCVCHADGASTKLPAAAPPREHQPQRWAARASGDDVRAWPASVVLILPPRRFPRHGSVLGSGWAHDISRPR